MTEKRFRDLEAVFQAKLERREFMRRLGLLATVAAASPYIGRYAWAQEELAPASQVIRGKVDALVVHNDSTGVLETPLQLLRQHRVTRLKSCFVRPQQPDSRARRPQQPTRLA